MEGLVTDKAEPKIYDKEVEDQQPPPGNEEESDKDEWAGLELDINFVEKDVSEDTWQEPYIKFLQVKILPEDPKVKATVLKDTWQFQMIEDSSGNPQEFSPLFKC